MIIFFLLRIFITFPRGGDGSGATRFSLCESERNSSQASKLERDSKQESSIYSSNLKNYTANDP